MLSADQGMIVRLRMAPGAEDAATLPWEFMADPTSGPISMMDAPVARYLRQPTPIPHFAQRHRFNQQQILRPNRLPACVGSLR
jgi:hypothetical protein